MPFLLQIKSVIYYYPVNNNYPFLFLLNCTLSEVRATANTSFPLNVPFAAISFAFFSSSPAATIFHTLIFFSVTCSLSSYLFSFPLNDISDTLPVIEIRGFHCLCGLNRVYPGFLLIPLNLATSTI